MSESMLTFGQWRMRWCDLAEFTGSCLPGPAHRAEQVLRLWDEPIPGSWKREIDNQLLGACYRRGDVGRPNRGEHVIEHEILSQAGTVRCLDGTLVDGVNAMPLSRDGSGGRQYNVEADLFLLVDKGGSYQLVICEVKCSANTPWYAAIENLRQLKLVQESTPARGSFITASPVSRYPRRFRSRASWWRLRSTTLGVGRRATWCVTRSSS